MPQMTESGGRMVPAKPVFITPRNSPASTGKVRRTSPIFLTASRLYQSGESSAVNQKALINHSGRPIEILEIRFQVLPASGVTLTGGAVSCQLSYNGKHEMTNSFVPVWSFARSYNMIDEMGLNATNHVMGFRLKLARPMWLQPGGFINATFHHNSLTQDALTAQIGLAGRILLDGPSSPPKKVCIPYVSNYQSKSFDGYGAADTDNSTENDLINPFEVPLRVQRFTHHTNIFDATGPLNHEYDNGYADLDSNLFQVRMVGSDGSLIVPTFSTMNQIFSRMTRSWECEHTLAPGGYYVAYLNKLAPPNLTTGTYQVVEHIGMVGYREVTL